MVTNAQTEEKGYQTTEFDTVNVVVIVVAVVRTSEDARAGLMLIPRHLEYILAKERLAIKVAVSHSDEIAMAIKFTLGAGTRW